MKQSTMKPSTQLALAGFAFLGLLLPIAGCGGSKAPNQGFFTSGSRDADQRADQRMVKAAQTKGEGANDTDSKEKKDVKTNATPGKPAQDNLNKTLYERLGSEAGLNAIVDDFVNRAITDPRVNWKRDGVTKGGMLHRSQSVAWDAKPDKVAQLKKHIVQFLSIATGGPAFYDGYEMKSAHANLHITNAEFDATIGDFKATLDKLQVANKEQKELLSIIESTRPQIALER